MPEPGPLRASVVARLREAGWWPDVRAALPAWVTARVVVALTLGFAHLVFDSSDPQSSLTARRLHRGLLAWDGEWYEDIAEEGYTGLRRLRFFPLFPLLARPLQYVVGSHRVALVVIANVAALALGALLHRLALRESGDERLARRAAWLVAFTPPAFTLVWGYAEALAGMLAVAFFLTVRSERWWVACVPGVLAGLTRPLGLLLVVPAAVEGARRLRQAPVRERLARLAGTLSPAAGAGAYLTWAGFRFGEPLKPLTIQQREEARGELAEPFGVLWRAIRQLASGDATGNAIHAPAALVVIVLVALTFRYWPVSYGAFAAVTLAVALSTTRLGSFERYTFGAFPVVLTLAVLTSNPQAERATLLVGGAAMVTFGTLALLGGYVP